MWYSGYGITFDNAGFWSFDNDTARNVIIFGVGVHQLILTMARVTFVC